MSDRHDDKSLPAKEAVYIPETINEAMQHLRQNRDTTIWAGGTHAMTRPSREGRVMSVHAVHELRRVIRREDHLEIGASVPLARLRLLGERFLPEVLRQALDEVGPPPLQNTATIGGLLAVPETILPTALVLRLLAARVEARRTEGTRWIALAGEQRALASEIRRGELITRVRVPSRRWTHWISHSFGRPYPRDGDSLTVAAMLAVDKETISEVRMAAVYASRYLVRTRELEAELVGKRHPLQSRDAAMVEQQLGAHATLQTEFSELARHRTVHGIISFLQQR